jgi:3'(2'), 5'-bisphosphate nucleotidase
MLPPTECLAGLAALARDAGAAVMQVYAGDLQLRSKADASPVTAADECAEAVILDGLRRLAPQVPVVAEESVAAGRVPAIGGGRFFLVDPLDGTREFISRNGEFTVNIALIEQGVPVLGVVFAPAVDGPAGRLFAGAAGHGAWVEDAQGRRPIRCRRAPPEGLTVLASRSHGDAAALYAFLADRRVARLANAGSSLKLCLIAEGAADCYPRHGRTMEWDIAAGHAVLAAAGGQVWRLDDGMPLAYGKRGFENPHFVAAGLDG